MKLKFITYFTIAIAFIIGNFTGNRYSLKEVTSAKDLCMDNNTIRLINIHNISVRTVFGYCIRVLICSNNTHLNHISFLLDVINETDTVVPDKKIKNIYKENNNSIIFNYLVPNIFTENFYFHKIRLLSMKEFHNKHNISTDNNLDDIIEIYRSYKKILRLRIFTKNLYIDNFNRIRMPI